MKSIICLIYIKLNKGDDQNYSKRLRNIQIQYLSVFLIYNE